MQFQRFLRRYHTRVDTCRHRKSRPSVKVGEALRCRCKLHAAHLKETGLAVMVKAIKFFNSLAGELRHGTRPISLENNARCVRCRAARLPKLTFFNDDYIAISAFSELICQ